MMQDDKLLTLIAATICRHMRNEAMLSGQWRGPTDEAATVLLAKLRERDAGCYAAMMREGALILRELERVGMLVK